MKRHNLIFVYIYWQPLHFSHLKGSAFCLCCNICLAYLCFLWEPHGWDTLLPLNVLVRGHIRLRTPSFPLEADRSWFEFGSVSWSAELGQVIQLLVRFLMEPSVSVWCLWCLLYKSVIRINFCTALQKFWQELVDIPTISSIY